MIRNSEVVRGVEGEIAIFPGTNSREVEIWRCPTKEEKEIALILGQISAVQIDPVIEQNKDVPRLNVPQPVETSWSVEDASSWLSVSNYRRALMSAQ